MPKGNLLVNIALQSRRVPILHRPLKWMRRVLLPYLQGIVIDFSRSIPASITRWGAVKGTFSLLEELRATPPKIEGRIIGEDQGTPVTSEDSLLVRCGMGHHLHQPWPFGWGKFENARLISSTLSLVNDKKKLCIEACYGPKFYKFDAAYKTIYLPRPLRLDGNWTSLLSRWVPIQREQNYTHWLIDALPRLAPLNEFPSDTRILVPPKLLSFQKESLELLGLKDRVRPTSERHVIVERYYLSTPTSMIDCYNPYAIQFLRDTFLPHADPQYSGPKKFLIDRVGYGRSILNRDEVNQYFKDLGWTILDAATLSFARQIKLFSEADKIAGVFGSGFMNVAWCKPGCKLLCFSPEGWKDGFYEWIADLNGVEHYYKIFPSDYAMRAQVDLTSVKEMLARIGE